MTAKLMLCTDLCIIHEWREADKNPAYYSKNTKGTDAFLTCWEFKKY